MSASVSACVDRAEEGPGSFTAAVVLGGVTYSPSQLRHGAEIYAAYCRPCHGVKGDGQGPSAVSLNPPPRDLRLGLFKFAAVTAGQLPADEDLRRTLRRGLAGTAMRGWDIPDEEVTDLLGYVKTFSPRWLTERPGEPLVASEDPWQGRASAAIERGERVYHGLAQCAVACHPAYVPAKEISRLTQELSHFQLTTFRSNLFEAVSKPSDYGYAILPPDFTFSRLRTGNELSALYRVIAAGVGGTAMPTWRGVLPESDLWSLAHYVRSLTELRDTPASETLRAELLKTAADGADAR